MSKFFLSLQLFLISYSSISGQTTSVVIYQPGPEDGIDVSTRSLDLDSAENKATYEYIRSSSWTHQGVPYVWTSFLTLPLINEFDDTKIEKIELVLYADREFTIDHGGQSYENESMLSLVKEYWLEDGVVWNNQPSYDLSPNIIIPQNNDYDSITVDITGLYREVKGNEEPFYGVVLQPVSPDPYRSMVFFSSDASDPSKRPKWKVTVKEDLNCSSCLDSYWKLTDVHLPNPGISRHGSVSIGTTDAKDYKLAVNGSIGAREITVDVAEWPDYVFKDDYDLMSLKDLSEFIQIHGQLPKVPSAVEAEQSGVALGEMSKLLLEKIEELTIYIIAMEGRQKADHERIAALEKKLGSK